MNKKWIKKWAKMNQELSTNPKLFETANKVDKYITMDMKSEPKLTKMGQK